MYWIILRFLLFTLWLFPLWRGCRKRHSDDKPWLFILLLTLLTLAWAELAPTQEWQTLLLWFLLPWLSLVVSRSGR